MRPRGERGAHLDGAQFAEEPVALVSRGAQFSRQLLRRVHARAEVGLQ